MVSKKMKIKIVINFLNNVYAMSNIVKHKFLSDNFDNSYSRFHKHSSQMPKSLSLKTSIRGLHKP